MLKNKFLTVSVPVILLVIALFYLTAQFITPQPKKEIIIATGSKKGEYYKTALQYKELLKKEKVNLKIVQTNGSIENINLLEKGEVDIAFIQDGTLKESKNIESLASIYYEPLWIFYNKNKNNFTYIKDALNKKISVGLIGSGTENLSLEILEANNIDKSNAKLINLTSKNAKDALLNGSIDFLFLVTSSSNQLLNELLKNKNLELLSIKRAKAYSKKFNYLNEVTLYEGIINLDENLPKEDKKLLSTTAVLMVNKEFSHELVRIFLKKVKQVHSSKSAFSQNLEFPNIKNIQTNLNEEAKRYFTYGDTWLEKIFPFWIASNLDRLKILLIPLLTLIFPLFKGVLPLYRWSIRSKIYRWYEELQEIDLSLEDSNKKDLENKLNSLEKLKKEIKDETKVPLSYMHEYYDLIMHVELIISKVNIKLK